MTFFQTRVPLSLNIVNIMQPYQFGKYKTNTSTCYNNNITLDLDHKLFKKNMGILSCVVTEALSMLKCVWNEVEIVTDFLLVK